MPPPTPQRPAPPTRASSAARYSALAPPPPPRPAGPPLFLFELGGDPLFEHPLWNNFDNTIPSLRVDVRWLYDHDGKHAWAPASGPADTVYGYMTMLARTMDGFARHSPRRPFRWFGIPAVFGGSPYEKEFHTCPNCIPLLNHPADRLKSGRRGPFFAEGLRRNRAWSAEFFEHLAAELARRKLPDPLAFILTSEEGPGDDHMGHHGSPDTGWMPESLADPRANDPAQTIDGRRTLAQYIAESRTLEGGPIPPHRENVPIGMPSGRAPVNDESNESCRGALRLAWDWSREQAFSSYARAAFARDPSHPERTVRIGEYEAACDSPWAPVRVRPLTLLHQMKGVFHTDLQCPGWYGGLNPLRTQPLFDADGPGWETRANWLRVYPNNEKDPARRDRRLALDIHKSIAQSCATSAPSSPLAPYVSNGDEALEDDMVEYLRHCRANGAWAVCVFMPKPDRAAHDYWNRVVPRVCA